MDDLYPVTITKARYNGGYEPGEWLAWPLYADKLPTEWDADDIPCRAFWESFTGEVGAGPTPQAAYEDLVAKVATD